MSTPAEWLEQRPYNIDYDSLFIQPMFTIKEDSSVTATVRMRCDRPPTERELELYVADGYMRWPTEDSEVWW